MDDRMNPHAPFEVNAKPLVYPAFPPRIDERAPAWSRVGANWIAQRPAQDGEGVLRKVGEVGSFPNGAPYSQETGQ